MLEPASRAAWASCDGGMAVRLASNELGTAGFAVAAGGVDDLLPEEALRPTSTTMSTTTSADAPTAIQMRSRRCAAASLRARAPPDLVVDFGPGRLVLLSAALAMPSPGGLGGGPSGPHSAYGRPARRERGR